MTDTLFTRTDRDHLAPEWQPAWDTLNKLTGDATFVEVFSQAPDMLRFVMQQFYAKIFFGGSVAQRYKQLARLELSLIHGCRTCNKQNVPGAIEAGFAPAQIDALRDGKIESFTPAEQAVIEYARQVALHEHRRARHARAVRQIARAFFGGRDSRTRHGHGGDFRNGQAVVRPRPRRARDLLPVRDRRGVIAAAAPGNARPQPRTRK